MIWVAVSWAQNCEDAEIVADEPLEDVVDRTAGPDLALQLVPGVYTANIDLTRFRRVEICGSTAGVVIVGTGGLGLFHGSVDSLVLHDLSLSPTNTAAVALAIAGEAELSGIQVTPGGLGSAVRMEGTGRLTVIDSGFIGGVGTAGVHLNISGDVALDIRNTTFRGALATARGGAILTANETTITNSTFEDNQALIGGAVASTGPLHIMGSTFVDNRAVCLGVCDAAEGDGGAVWSNDPNGSIGLGSTFRDNSAQARGGAVAMTLGRSDVVGESTFCGNQADVGGALHLISQETPRLGHLRLFDNVANAGAAVFGSVQLDSVTLLGNSSAEGGIVTCGLAEGEEHCASIRQGIVAYNAGPVLDRVEVSRTVAFQNQTLLNEPRPDGEGATVTDPLLRGYVPGLCGDKMDFFSPFSEVHSRNVNNIQRVPFPPDCEGGTCLPLQKTYGAYGFLENTEEGDRLVFGDVWLDQDGDGFPAVMDCNDFDDEVPGMELLPRPGETQVRPALPGTDPYPPFDHDCDGTFDLDRDGDGFLAGLGDCDDGDASIFPGAADESSSRDLDCDKLIEDELPRYKEVGCNCRRLRSGESDSDLPAGFLWITLLGGGLRRYHRGRRSACPHES